jgi:flagellar basal body-associated protein FliL
LKDQELKVRDLLMPVLQASSQEEVMNPTRKLALRRRMAEKLNELDLKGRVIQIDFNDMILESGQRER